MDQGHLEQLHDRSRWSEPAALHLVDGRNRSGDDLLLEPHSVTGQPQGVPQPHADPPDRNGRNLHLAGPHSVLRVLRGRAPADVLHDRCVGRRAAAVRVAQVLPLHHVRIGAHARRLHRLVLQGPRRTARRCRSIVLHAAARRVRRLARTVGPDLDLRRHVRGIRGEGSDVPVPHVVARRSYASPHAGFGHPGRDPPETRNLRFRAHRDSDSARSRQGLGTLDRVPCRDRHHLRRLRMSGPDRHEATHCVLVGRAHGIRDARHFHAHAHGFQCRVVRHGRPRSDHRHVVLHRGFGEGALPHARDRASWWHAQADAAPRLDPRLLCDGVTRTARTRRLLG